MTTFIGTIKDATGGLLLLTIAGPNHFIYSHSYTQSFNTPFDLKTGDYVVTVSVATSGTFTFDITGDAKNIDPKVPLSFNKTLQMFTLNVG